MAHGVGSFEESADALDFAERGMAAKGETFDL